MARVRIADKRVWVDDESRALIAGEVHFWRLDASVWPAVLDRVRELGLDMVSTYVCWDFHELRPGKFDFAGETNPRRNLRRWLDLVKERGMWQLLRPGPYIYAEWPNSGIPERTVQWHRLHPRFLQEAEVWMRAVAEAVKPYLGAPIVLVQADNEADPWIDVYAEQLGLADEPGLFQDFLNIRYAHIADLNAAWDTSYSGFAEARAVLAPVNARHEDVARFRHWYATAVVRWTTERYRSLGVDVPIYANTYADTAIQDWRALETVCDLTGPDVYPTSRLAEDPDEHRLMLESVRYAHCYSRLPFIPEFEAGIWHGWHTSVGVLAATNYALNAWTALLGGVAGWNWYMLVARDNWYMSPVTELGRFRPELAGTFSEIVNAFRELDPPSLEKVTDTAVTFTALQPDHFHPVLRTLYDADIDYEFFDLQGEVSEKRLTFHTGKTLTSDLVDYVYSGGTLVQFQPSEPSPSRVTIAAAPHRLRIGVADIVLSSATVFVYVNPPGEPIVAERIEPLPPIQEGGHAHLRLPVGERFTIGYVQGCGRGRRVVIGVEPTPELMIALHQWLGVPIACRAPFGSHVQSALFRRGDVKIAILTNTNDHPIDVPLEIGDERVTAHVPARSGTFVQLS